MKSSQQLVEEFLPLAEVIAFDYANIPGVSQEEALSEARMALIRAADAFDPARGEFSPFAAKVMRNSLNTLYSKHLRMVRMFPVSLDNLPGRETGPLAGTPLCRTEEQKDSKQDVLANVRNREAQEVLNDVLKILSPRERLVIDGIRRGNSLSEIGEELGVSKQAVHKTVRAGLEKLRLGLERLGYKGVASDGHLKSENPNDSHSG